MASCGACGSETPAGSRFCPHCGARLEENAGSTAVIEPPPDETGPVPVASKRTGPHLFGVTPPMALLALAAAALAVGVLLLTLGNPLAGASVVAVAVVLFAAFVGAARRVPGSRIGDASVSAVGTVRSRVGTAAGSLATRTRARREVARVRGELHRLNERRRRLLLRLGEAVYDRDEQATESLRGELLELDREQAHKEAELEEIVAAARAELERARLEVQPTEVVGTPPAEQPAALASGAGAEPPEPARVPEPYPPPGEADPPEPARVPEPYPPPDEADPPRPVRTPETDGGDRS